MTGISRYETYELMAMIEEMEVQRNFFTALFFPDVRFSESDHIEFDLVRKGKRVAPFVAPLAAAPTIMREGYITKSFKPAYVKVRSMVFPTDTILRLPGEGYNNQGNLTKSQRWDRLMAQDLATHSEMLDNRIEWMAANAVINDGYVVSGEGYQTTQVAFGRPATLDVALAGAATWDQVTADPIQDIEDMGLAIRNESRGTVIDTVVFGNNAWRYFSRNDAVRDRIDRDILRANVSVIDDGVRLDIGLMYRGRLDGKIDLWEYSDFLTDDNGDDVELMDPDLVIVASRNAIDGAVYYGQIFDKDAEFQALRQYVKSQTQFDPTAEEVISSSAPLVAPKRVNTIGTINVA